MPKPENTPKLPPPETAFDAARALESVRDAFFVLDENWRFVYVNDQSERIMFRKREELLGRVFWDEFPAAVGSAFERAYRRAVAENATVSFEEFYPPLNIWVEVRAYPSAGGLSVFYQDVTARRQAEEALRRSREDLRLAIDAARLGTFYCDWPLDKIIWNKTCKEHFFLPPDAEVDFALFYSLLHPDDREPTRQAITQAQAERVAYDVEYRTLAPDGRTRWVNAVGRFYYGPDGSPVRFDGITVDISARKTAEEAGLRRARRERFLADLAERTRRMTDPQAVIADAVRSLGVFLGASRVVFADIDLATDSCTIPLDYCADETVASMAGTFPISAFGPFLVGEYRAGRTVAANDVWADPARFPAAFVAAYNAVAVRAFVAAPVLHSDRLVSVIAAHSPVPRIWTPEEVEILQTVVERTWLTVEVLRQQRALVREAEERREANERTAAILDSITDAFYAIDREWRFSYLNAQAARLLFRTREELLGRVIWEELPEAVGGTFYRLYHRAMDEGIPISFEDYYAPLDSWMDVRVYPSPDGISIFFQNVNARKQADAERERLLAEQRARAEREALLNRIGQALRDSSDPDAAQETAAALLGEALGADRCYFALYDLTGGTVRIARDWHRADLPSVQGTHIFANTAAMFQELYRNARTSVVPDAADSALSAQTRANMERLQIRSRVSVALAEADGLAATLTAAMADGPRAWTNDEVALVEAAATQLRLGVEAARLQQREHRIAEQLQEALQPALPASIPGLSVGRFTRPALDEAQVGGDFYDIFPLDKELYALVIGDVSGKGLAAAQQLALIRNSLRTTLYLSRRPAQAAASLNAIVTAHDLLVGFVTAWVGVYDAATGRIAYCSCGHEPGLLRRADGRVEGTETTGPPLGVAENAEYGEESVTLSSGDALLLYTDGISEAGPSRRAMLGTTGLMRLFGALPAEQAAQPQAEALVEEVSAFTGGIFRDDVAVLLVRRL